MDASFWHDKWARGEIGFHQPQVNPLLLQHYSALNLGSGKRIFVPLCGKTHDLGWLMNQGLSVVGAELSELAVNELFEELGLTPDIEQLDDVRRYRAAGIEVFVGDVFGLHAARLGKVDAVYDRAALVALPSEIRADYAQHLANITDCAPQLLLCFEYDQNAMNGPPFCVTEAEIRRCYGERMQLELLARTPMEGGFRGSIPCRDAVWKLSP